MKYAITPLIKADLIEATVKELAVTMERDMGAGAFILLVLLKGAAPFADMLNRFFTVPAERKFIKVRSYAGMNSTGTLKWEQDCGPLNAETPVLVVDDVLDTGRTLMEVCQELKRRGVKTVKTAVAVDKSPCRAVPFEADYVAFTCGDEFLVGFGMDLDEKHRDLPYIGVVTPQE